MTDSEGLVGFVDYVDPDMGLCGVRIGNAEVHCRYSVGASFGSFGLGLGHSLLLSRLFAQSVGACGNRNNGNQNKEN